MYISITYHAYVCVRMNTRVRMNLHVCMHELCVSACTYVEIYVTYIHISITYHAYMCARMNYVHLYVYDYKGACTYVRMNHVYIHIYVYLMHIIHDS